MLLDVGDIARENTLNYVSAIEAIHTVSSHNPSLCAQNPASLWVDEVSLSESNVQLGHEVPVCNHFVLHLSNKFAQVLPLHFLTLTVEIKPHILDIRVVQLCDKLGKFVSNALLTALLIDEIDKVLLFVFSVSLCYMLFCHLERCVHIWIHDYRRCPLQGGFHAPE